ncbi:MAG: hypothetical protein IPI10_14655 [Bacteroidetes bacterium]|nr:hypothetical protein [Bacteroidota bacterium]
MRRRNLCRLWTFSNPQELINVKWKDHDKWVDFKMRFGVGFRKPDSNRARMSARNIESHIYIVGWDSSVNGLHFTETPNEG